MVLKKGVSAAGEGKLFIVQICQKKVPMLRTNELVSLHTKKASNKTLEVTAKEFRSYTDSQKIFSRGNKKRCIIRRKKSFLLTVLFF